MNISNEYIEHIVTIKELSATSFRVLLLLQTKKYTQSQIANILGTDRQRMNKVFKDLKLRGLIISLIPDGKNIYYKAECNMKNIFMNIPGQTKLDEFCGG